MTDGAIIREALLEYAEYRGEHLTAETVTEALEAVKRLEARALAAEDALAEERARIKLAMAGYRPYCKEMKDREMGLVSQVRERNKMISTLQNEIHEWEESDAAAAILDAVLREPPDEQPLPSPAEFGGQPA